MKKETKEVGRELRPGKGSLSREGNFKKRGFQTPGNTLPASFRSQEEPGCCKVANTSFLQMTSSCGNWPIAQAAGKPTVTPVSGAHRGSSCPRAAHNLPLG